MKAQVTKETVQLPYGVHIEFLSDKSQFKGLGSVEVEGVRLRGSRRPMFAEIRTPEGIEFFDFEVKNKKGAADGLVFEFAMKARASGVEDWMVHTVRNRVVTRDWAEPEWTPAVVLKLHLRGIEQTFSGRTFKGFEYFYEYESQDHPIYRLLDRSSWAINGSIAGQAFWLRNCFAPSIRSFAGLDEYYSSEWYVPNARNPSIFQFQPFQTNLESFTMTVAEEGQLLTIAPKLAHLRSFFEKPYGADELLHWHEHCGDLATKFSTAPIQVLFCNRPATRVDLINLHHAVKERVAEDLHRQAGFRRERIMTNGVIEEWTRPDLDHYADHILPKLLETGVRCIFLPNQFQNNMNVWNANSMCATVDYKMDSPEEEEKLRRFCVRAREADTMVQMWGNTAISSLDYTLRPLAKGASGRANFLPMEDSIFDLIGHTRKKEPDPFVRNPSGAIESDHYAPNFMVLNLREPAVRAYWHKRWKYAHDYIGLEGIFLDSAFNLSSDKFHFIGNAQGDGQGATSDQSHLLGHLRPRQEAPKAVLSMYFAHLQLMTEMQNYGYQYCGEDIGVFGVHRSGPGIEKRLDNLFLWADCLKPFDRSAVLKAGRNPDEIFFQGLAYRMMWTVRWDFKRNTVSFCHGEGTSEDDPTPWHISLLRAFNEVESQMLDRTVIEEEKGVVYESKHGKVLWAFASFDFELPPGAKVREILTNKVFEGARLQAKKHHIYCIEIPDQKA